MKNLIKVLKNPANKKRVKGSVLYTVVGVMMVLTIFVMSALALAASANKRAYQTYAKAQTQYTARSVVEGVINQLTDPDNASLGQSILGMTTGKELSLNMVDSTGAINNQLPDGMGVVKSLKIKYIGKDEIGTTNYVCGSGKTIVQVSAEVELAGKTSTFSQYLLNEYRAKITTTASPDAGFISTGAMGNTNNPYFYGDAYFNVEEKDTTGGSYEIRNDGVLTGNLYFNKGLKFNANPSFQWGAGQGIVVNGNLERSDNLYQFTSIAGTSIDYLDIPYVYVAGEINQGKKDIGTAANPINVYCGSYKSERDEQPSVYGDIYAYNESGISSLGGAKPTKLINWANSIINNLNGTNSLGGNFFTKGSLNIQGSNEMFTIQGDVIVDKDLTIQNIKNGTNYIDGTVVVGGTLNINAWNDKNINIKGGLYCEPTAITVTGDVLINGVKYSDYGDGKKVEFLQAVNRNAQNSPFYNPTNPDAKIALNSVISVNSIKREILFTEPDLTALVWNGAGYVEYGSLKTDYANLSAIATPTDAEIQQLKDTAKYMYDAQYLKLLTSMIKNTKTGTDTYKSYMTTLGYLETDIDANTVNNTEVLFPPKMEMKDLENNVIPTKESIESKFFTTVGGVKQLIGMITTNTKGVNTIYKKARNQGYLTDISKAELPAGVFQNQVGTETNPITTDCTLVADGSNTNIYINPGTNEIWVNLISQWGNSFKGNIIVNTSLGGKVNFFVPENGQKFEYTDLSGNKQEIIANGNITFENIKIMTNRYYNAYKNGEQLNLAKYVYDADPTLVPNIYFYMPGNGVLRFNNPCIFTGYIYAPNSEFYFNQGVSNFHYKVDYGYYDTTATPATYVKTSDVQKEIGVIGSLIVGDAKDITNQFALIHVTPDSAPTGGGGGGGGSVTEVNQWTAISYGGYAGV